MALIEAEQCDSVRRAIDTSLKARKLPNAVILDPIYAGQAEIEVRAVTLESSVASRTAAIYICAALLIENGAVPQLTQERQGDLSYSRLQMLPKVKAANLRARAQAQLSLTEKIPTEVATHSDDFSLTRNIKTIVEF